MDAQTLSEHIREVENIKKHLYGAIETSTHLSDISEQLSNEIRNFETKSSHKKVALDGLKYQRGNGLKVLDKLLGIKFEKTYKLEKEKLIKTVDSYTRGIRYEALHPPKE